MVTVKINTLLKDVISCLKSGEIDDPIYEGRLLVSGVLNISLKDILLNDIEIRDYDYKRILNLAKKRAENYPLQYIIGHWDFYNYTFFVGEGVLIPRQDTECLVESVIEYIGEKDNLVIADLCSGSGNIAITIDKEKKNNKVFAIEYCEKAYNYLLKNIEHNKANVIPVLSDVFSWIPNETLDIIVSNPPYLNLEDMKSLQPEVTFEPYEALYANENGLYFYKNITKIYKNLLKKGGLLAFEIGIGQDLLVVDILKENNFNNINTIKDLCGIIRVVTAIK